MSRIRLWSTCRNFGSSDIWFRVFRSRTPPLFFDAVIFVTVSATAFSIWSASTAVEESSLNFHEQFFLHFHVTQTSLLIFCFGGKVAPVFLFELRGQQRTDNFSSWMHNMGRIRIFCHLNFSFSRWLQGWYRKETVEL